MISKTSTVTPHFFAFLAKVDHYLSAWQVLKKSVRGNVLGANVLKISSPCSVISGSGNKVSISPMVLPLFHTNHPHHYHLYHYRFRYWHLLSVLYSRLDAPKKRTLGCLWYVLHKKQKALNWEALNCSVPVNFFKWGAIKTIRGITHMSRQQRRNVMSCPILRSFSFLSFGNKFSLKITKHALE